VYVVPDSVLVCVTGQTVVYVTTTSVVYATSDGLLRATISSAKAAVAIANRVKDAFMLMFIGFKNDKKRVMMD